MKRTKKKAIAIMLMMVLIASAAFALPANAAIVKNYGNQALSGTATGHFDDVWDLTASDMTITFTYDATGLIDGAGHAWGALGIRQVGYGDFNPTWDVEGAGVWLATDFDWGATTFDPDPAGAPTLDLDDKLLLQKAGGHGEGDYNLPSAPPAPGNNHRFWFDRDGVDPWQGAFPAINGGTFNTGGVYSIVITLHATSSTTGTAYMTVNGLEQGFETNGNWATMELNPSGMTFTGNMRSMQVYYGMYGYGGAHAIAFNDITVTGALFGIDHAIPEVPLGAVVACAVMLVALVAYVGIRKQKATGKQ